MIAPIKAQTGFTILELIVSLAITALLLAAMAEAMDSKSPPLFATTHS